jgi:hypothetical protein
MPTNPRSFSTDVYTKFILTIIALLLGVLAFRPALRPLPVRAQADSPRFYFEPGSTVIRKPGGDIQLPGKVVVDLENGDIWGFLTNNQDLPYPVDVLNDKPPVAPAIYLGRFDFAGMKHPNASR